MIPSLTIQDRNDIKTVNMKARSNQYSRAIFKLAGKAGNFQNLGQAS